MKLTEDQIGYLFRFSEQHYADEYDVQVEIVDHLASAIEERLRETPDQKFEQVLHEVYTGFGVMGLSGFIDSMQKKVSRQSRKMFTEEFRRFFLLPRILLSLLVFSGLFFLFQNLSLTPIRYTILGVVLIGSLGLFTQFFLLRKTFKRRLLHWQQPYVMAASGALLNVFNLFLKEKRIEAIPNYPLAMAALTGLCFLLFYSSLIVSQNIYKRLKRDYPEAFK